MANFRLPRGSIPALTGKPGRGDFPEDHPGVYPRAYGETAFDRAAGPVTDGLSPRLRGNPAGRADGRQALGSIPALTGKPTSAPKRGSMIWVYPRAYGETAGTPVVIAEVWGLSPRLRGNPLITAAVR